MCVLSTFASRLLLLSFRLFRSCFSTLPFPHHAQQLPPTPAIVGSFRKSCLDYRSTTTPTCGPRVLETRTCPTRNESVAFVYFDAIVNLFPAFLYLAFLFFFFYNFFFVTIYFGFRSRCHFACFKTILANSASFVFHSSFQFSPF